MDLLESAFIAAALIVAAVGAILWVVFDFFKDLGGSE